METGKKILGWGKYEFVMLCWFFFTWGTVFLDRLVMPFLAPMVMADLGLNEMMFALQNTLITGFYALGAIFLTGFLEASGKRKVWLVSLSLGSGIFAILGGLSQTAVQLIVTRAVVGLLQGPVAPILFAMLIKESSESKIALNAGIVNMGVAVVAVTIGPVAMTQLAVAFSWRWSFFVTGGTSVIGALAMLKVLRDAAFVPTDEKRVSVFKSMAMLLKYRNVLLSFILGMLTMCAYWTLMNYATRFFSEVGGQELTSAGFIVGLMGVLGILWTVIVPKLSDYLGRKGALILWYIVCAVAPFVMFGAPTSFAAIVVYGLVGGIPGAIFPFFQAIIPGESLPNHLLGTASGLIIGVSELIGGSGWIAVLGVIATNAGLPTVILTAGIALVLAAIVTLFVKETKQGKRAEDKKA